MSKAHIYAPLLELTLTKNAEKIHCQASYPASQLETFYSLRPALIGGICYNLLTWNFLLLLAVLRSWFLF
jgi:hypothetical protein